MERMNMGMKTINSLRTAFLASALVVLSGGCELDTVPDWGQACPPNGIVRGELSYIQMGSSARCQDGDGCFSEEFEYDVCPERYSRCNVDSEGKYYCMQKCPSGQIACDGLCIDAKANDAFCGAENTCSGVECCRNYETCGSWQTCIDGKCQDKACTVGTPRCTDGVVYVCQIDGNATKWMEAIVCENRTCNAENSGCASESPCYIDGKSVMHGQRACSGDGRKVYGCMDGEIHLITECAEGLVCGGDKVSCVNYASCLDGETVVSHEQKSCRDASVQTYVNGSFVLGVDCSKNTDGKTACRDGACVVANCFVDGNVLGNRSSICRGSKLYRCDSGVLNETLDCSKNADGKTACRDGQCSVPKNCTADLDGASQVVKDGARVCRGDELLTCTNGNIETVQHCDVAGYVCQDSGDDASCAPVFRSIKAMRGVFDHLYDKEVCSKTGNIFVDANVEVIGVVTAMRMTQNNYGFVMQELGDNPKHSGIIVNCKTKACQKYDDGSKVAIGDVVAVTSTQLNSYYCQLQVFQESGSVSVKKVNLSTQLQPVVIDAAQLDSPTEYEPNNPYNNVLVAIKNVSIASKQDKGPAGFAGIDAAGSDVFVNNALFLDEDNALSQTMPIELKKTYDVVGVGLWSYNKSTLAPRNASDIAEVKPCEGKKGTTAICIRREGKYLSATCTDGVLGATPENCTEKGQICDVEEVAVVNDAETPKSLCRAAASCADSKDNPIIEGDWGYENDTKLTKCLYNKDCKAGEADTCSKGIWSGNADESKTCSKACNVSQRICDPAAIKKCGLSQLDAENSVARVRVEDISDGDVEAYIYCTLDETAPIASWPYKMRLVPVPAESCPDCPKDVTEYVSMRGSLPSTTGTYTCVAVATVASGDSFVCSKSLIEPKPLNPDTKVNESQKESYEVGNVTRILAKWDFNTEDCTKLTSGVLGASTFSLSAKQDDVKCNSSYVAAQTSWGTGDSADFEEDPYWAIVVDTTGYANIALSFEIRSSKPDNLVTVAYCVTDGGKFTAIGDPVAIPNSSLAKIDATLPETAANAGKVTMAIFPHKTELIKGVGPNIRIDNVVVRGVAIEE